MRGRRRYSPTSMETPSLEVRVMVDAFSVDILIEYLDYVSSERWKMEETERRLIRERIGGCGGLSWVGWLVGGDGCGMVTEELVK
jgi:hypothetical protein